MGRTAVKNTSKCAASKTPKSKLKAKKPKTKEVGAASTSSTRQIDYMGVDLVNKEEKERWARLCAPTRTVQCTKFIDMTTLEEFEMADVMRRLFTRVGMEGFLAKRAKTYVEYTYEFLATLEDDGKKITFGLNNEEHEMTYAAIRESFGWTVPSNTREWKEPFSGDRYNFWKAITSGRHKLSGDYACHIPHPCLCLAHRFLNTTVYCQGEGTKMNSLGVNILWSMTPEGVGDPDWVRIFINGCVSARDKGSGHLIMGGMITLLAEYLKIKAPKSLEPVDSTYMSYNLATLVKVGMVSKTDKGNF